MKMFRICDNISLDSSSNKRCFRQSVEKIKTHILCSVTFLRKSFRLWDNVEEYGWTKDRRHYGACVLPNGTFQVSRGSIVGIATRLRTGQSEVWIPIRARDFSLLLNIQRGSTAHPTPPLKRHRGYCPGTKPQAREINYSSPASTQIKNEWNCISTPPISLHGGDRDNFTFIMVRPPIKGVWSEQRLLVPLWA
jgi:hypothetical protein